MCDTHLPFSCLRSQSCWWADRKLAAQEWTPDPLTKTHVGPRPSESAKAGLPSEGKRGSEMAAMDDGYGAGLEGGWGVMAPLEEAGD